MPNLNKVLIMGNLTRDPELKFTPSGTATCEIGIAINRTWKNDRGEKMEETTFVSVEVWGKQAELCAEYLRKGRPVYIEGRLKIDSWEKDGVKKTKTKIVGESMQFLGSRDSDGERDERPSARTQQRPPAAARKPAPRDPDLDVDGDDVPF